MTLSGHYALHCTKHAYVGAYKENLNDDRIDHTVGGEDVAQ